MITHKQKDSKAKVRIFIMVDNTGSMGATCAAIGNITAQVIAMFSLLDQINIEFNLCTIGDYDEKTPNWQEGGWAYLPHGSSLDQLKTFLKTYCVASGGGGIPEAYKTGINNLLFQIRPTKETLGDDVAIENIIINLCDAVPHGTDGTYDLQGQAEQKYLSERSMISDWAELCAAVKDCARFITILTTNNPTSCRVPWDQMGRVVPVAPIKDQIQSVLMTFLNRTFGLPLTASTSESADQFEQLFVADTSNVIANSRAEDVLNVFRFLIDPTNPETVICLTTNYLIGKFWRHLCGKLFNDPHYTDECQVIMDLVSSCVGSLPDSLKTRFKEWNNSSHDQTEMVRELFQGALDRGATQFLGLSPLFKTAGIEELLNFARTAQFKGLLGCISAMEPVQPGDPALPEDKSEAPICIPLDGCKKGTVLSMLATLIVPGNLFPRQATFMVAILCLANKYLREIALEYLTEHRGKWIKWELDERSTQKFPVFWSLGFIRLLTLAPDDVLTDEERDFRDHYLMVANVVGNAKMTISIVTAKYFTGLYRYHTWKHRTCERCGQKRCFTIFPADSAKCGICISLDQSGLELCPTSPYLHPETIVDEGNKTNWAQCSACKGNYAVEYKDGLRKCRPKCHFCRKGEPVQTIQCCTCLGLYLNPRGSAMEAMSDELASLAESEGPRRDLLLRVQQENKFVCPRCVMSTDPSEQTSEFVVTIRDLMAENPCLRQRVPLSPYPEADNAKLWQLAVDCKPVDLNQEGVNGEQPTRLTWKQLDIHKPEGVAEEAISLLTTHDGYETCQLCVASVKCSNMLPACGNCNNRMCRQCVTRWYGEVKIGQLVSSAQCTCPFCKSDPHFDRMPTLEMGAIEMRLIRNRRPTKNNKGQTCDWDEQTLYGFCRCCLHLKPAMARECARGDLPDVQNFVCEQCQAQRDVQREAQRQARNQAQDQLDTDAPTLPVLVLKECPNCKTMVERTGGCNHITCNCGAHWCWTCCSHTSSDGDAFDESTIYDHMAECGGIFPLDFGDI